MLGPVGTGARSVDGANMGNANANGSFYFRVRVEQSVSPDFDFHGGVHQFFSPI